MDRGVRNNLGLGILEEEEDEAVIGRSEDEDSEEETESEGDDDADEGVRRGEPNKFDGLCDGVLNAMALVHGSLQDLLELKDEMLRHSLPPTLLYQLSLVSGRIFRSISDLGMPVGELVRLVRVYSTPWEEKSAALKKLHEDYESKQRQLNIAIKRLQLVDAHSKRVAREKRIMNWEKLFSKMTTAKGHGRRWKFLIETIKQKAQLGLEHVQAYTQGLQESSESEDEEVVTEPARTIPPEDEVSENPESDGVGGTEGSRGEAEEDVEEDDEEDEDVGERGEDGEGSVSKGSDTGESEGTQSEDVPTVSIIIGAGEQMDIDGRGSRSASPKKVRFEESFAKPLTIRPPMRDSDTWTEEPDYDRSLFIRIFCPEGLEHTGLRCSLSYEGHMFKTPILDSGEEEGMSETSGPDLPDERPSKRPHAARKGDERSTTDASQSETGSNKSKNKKFFEFEIKLPDEISDGILVLGEKPPPEPENLRIAVHHGQFEEIVAMATIDFQDIKELALETVFLTPPHGDDELVTKSRANSLSGASSLGGESLSDSMDIPIMEDDSPDNLVSSTPRDDLVKGKEPLPFPLYSLHAGKSDSVHMPCGNVPLLMYWGKRARPLHFNRQCGTLGVYDLVYDMTGIDLNTTTKEDLHKEMVDEALSVVAFTPEVQEPVPESEDKATEVEETVLKSEYDKMVEKHQEEMMFLQEEYEKRLQEMINSLQAMQSENNNLAQASIPQQRPISVTSRVSSTPGGITPITSKRSEPSFHGSDQNLPSTAQPSLRQVSREKTVSEVEGDKTFLSQPSTVSSKLRPLPPRNQKPSKNFRIGRPLPKWGEHLPQDFFERLRLWQEETKQHKQEINERTLKEIKENLEKKLAGQHKLSKREEQIYDALKDVSLPALFMPYKTGNIYNPRAHQYFHPTGATEVRLTQPPSVFQLPPLPNSKMSVVNLFELSKNFHNRGPAWLVERYIQQQQPLNEGYPQTPAPTSAVAQVTNSEQTPFNDNMDSPSSRTSIQREVET